MRRKKIDESNKGLSGILAINKPRGMITKDVSREIERRFGRMKLGHVGTLDPLAEGVLPIVIGSCTKLQDYILDLPKSYLFQCHFGKHTDTLDSEGQILFEEEKPQFSDADLEQAMSSFVGEIEQVPPVYSAVKVNGVALYDLARAGKYSQEELDTVASERKRTVTIYSFDLVEVTWPLVTFQVRCSKGTYVRSLARDVAETLGTVAMITKIVRTESSGLVLDQCIDLKEVLKVEDISGLFLPVSMLNTPFDNWVAIEDSWQKKLRNGGSLLLDARYLDMGFACAAENRQKAFERLAIDLPHFQKSSFGKEDAPMISSNEILDKREYSNSYFFEDFKGHAFGVGCIIPNTEGQFVLKLRKELA